MASENFVSGFHADDVSGAGAAGVHDSGFLPVYDADVPARDGILCSLRHRDDDVHFGLYD